MIPKEVLDILEPLVKRFEGLRLSAYQDSAGIWTIGWGHTEGVQPGQVWTLEEAQEALGKDMDTRYTLLLLASPGLVQQSAGRQAALTDFVYNLGIGKYKTSTLRSAVDVGAWQAVKAQLARWVYSAGKIQPGLQARRQAEIDLIDT